MNKTIKVKNLESLTSFFQFAIMAVCILGVIRFFNVEPKKMFITYNIFMLATMVFSYFSMIAKDIKISCFFLMWTIISISYLYVFRLQTGTDDFQYYMIFNNAAGVNIFEYISNSELEIGFTTVNYLIYKISGGNYYAAQIFFSLTPIVLIEYSLWKQRDNLDFPLANLFIYMNLYYYVMSAGLMRIFFAIGIVFYGLKFIINDQPLKYFLTILIASAFHLSAFFMLILLLLFWQNEFYFKHLKQFVFIIVIIIPLLLMLICRYIVPFMGQRYQMYYFDGNIVLPSLAALFDRLPFILIGLYYLKTVCSDDPQTEKRYKLYFLLIMLTLTVNLSSLFLNLGRLVYYTNCGTILLIPLICRNKKIIASGNGIIVSLVSVILVYVYLMVTIFLNNYNWQNLMNYHSLFE